MVTSNRFLNEWLFVRQLFTREQSANIEIDTRTLSHSSPSTDDSTVASKQLRYAIQRQPNKYCGWNKCNLEIWIIHQLQWRGRETLGSSALRGRKRYSIDICYTQCGTRTHIYVYIYIFFIILRWRFQQDLHHRCRVKHLHVKIYRSAKKVRNNVIIPRQNTNTNAETHTTTQTRIHSHTHTLKTRWIICTWILMYAVKAIIIENENKNEKQCDFSAIIM